MFTKKKNLNKKKLIKTKKRDLIVLNMSKTTNHREFKTILAGYVRTDNFDNIPEWLEIYKQDFPGPIDKDTLNSLISYTTSINFKDKKEMLKYLDLVLEHNTYEDFNETSFTSFIKIYSDTRYLDFEKIKGYLMHMMMNDIKIKRRTLAPIFDNELDLSLCLGIYNISKNLEITLNDVDYINIMNTIFQNNPSDKFNLLIVLRDLLENHYILSSECISTLDNLFKTNKDLVIDIDGNIENGEMKFKKLPEFKLTSKDITKFSDKIELHVGNVHPKKKKSLLEFRKFLNKNMKKYDTVLDGANVGFFQQGTNSGKVLNFRQIQMFVDKAVEMKRKVLLILHERHLRNISATNMDILKDIKKKTISFFSPQGNDDDMYWLYSSIVNPKAKIITNDEMRNHIVNISAGDMFTEWKKYRRIQYNILGSEVILHMPNKYMDRPLIENNNLIIPFKNENGRINWKYYVIE